MRRLLFLLFALASVPAFSQTQTERVILRDYDIDSTSTIYACLGDPIKQTGNLTTVAGGSTTVTAVGSFSFGNIGVGDEITVTVSGVDDRRLVTAKASNTSLTISGSAVDWHNAGAGYPFNVRKFTSGTGDVCWINVGDYPNRTWIVNYKQGDLTGGLSFELECKGSQPGATSVQVYPSNTSDCGGTTGITTKYLSGFCNIATAPGGFSLGDGPPFDYGWCRVGLKAVTGDPDDSGANIEQVTVTLRMQNPR